MSHQETSNPLPGVEAHPGSGHYGVYHHGAHVWAWQPDGERPVLWLSAASMFEAGKPIRGGVPVIFPWFGPGRAGNLQPAHGFVRTLPWHCEAVDEADGHLVVRYRLDASDTGDQPNFPYPYTAMLRVDFMPDAVDIDLGITNTGDREFSYEEALHTYLAVGDVREVSVEGLDGVRYWDKVAGQEAVQDGMITITGETDRVYHDEGSVVVHDPVWERRIRVEKSGSANTVVWNPWIAKAAAMADFGDDEWPGMICIEAANAMDNAIVLAPGETHVMRQRISLG